MTTDTALQAADAVFMTEQAVGRARGVVDELHTTINSAIRVLDDAELDSARARLSDRGGYYLEAAGEHLSRLQRRCSEPLTCHWPLPIGSSGARGVPPHECSGLACLDARPI